MSALCHFFPSLSPTDYWQLTGHELAALLAYRTAWLDEAKRAANP
jgi:hypothetical protein